MAFSLGSKIGTAMQAFRLERFTVVCKWAKDAAGKTRLAAAMRRRIQYVVLPPEISKVAAVEKEHSSLASQHTKAALSFASPNRPIGMRERI